MPVIPVDADTSKILPALTHVSSPSALAGASCLLQENRRDRYRDLPSWWCMAGCVDFVPASSRISRNCLPWPTATARPPCKYIIRAWGLASHKLCGKLGKMDRFFFGDPAPGSRSLSRPTGCAGARGRWKVVSHIRVFAVSTTKLAPPLLPRSAVLETLQCPSVRTESA